MTNYILKLELNCKNKMIFAVQHREKDIALIMYEDCRRKGELMRDFSFLYPQYYSSEKEWNDHRNLIKISIFLFGKNATTPDIKDDLVYLAESMIEYKPEVNHKLQFVNDPKVEKYYLHRDSHRTEFVNYMFSLCEQNEDLNFEKDAFNHLMQ